MKTSLDVIMMQRGVMGTTAVYEERLEKALTRLAALKLLGKEGSKSYVLCQNEIHILRSCLLAREQARRRSLNTK